jgi:hypothetical protein
MSDCCPFCRSPFTCALSRTSHYRLYPSHEHGHPTATEVKEDIILTENLRGKTRRRRKEQEE